MKSFEELTELVQVINRNKIKDIELVHLPNGEKPSQVQELYRLVTEGKIRSDEDISRHFFPRSPRGREYSLRLVRDLKDRLLNTLFFIDTHQPGFTDIQQSYYSCFRNYTAFKFLIGRGSVKAAVELAERTLPRALQYEFTEINLFLCKYLMSYYGVQAGNKIRFREYASLLADLSSLLVSEVKAEMYYVELIIPFAKSISSNPEMEPLAEQYALEARQLLTGKRSQVLVYYTYQIQIFRYLVVGRHQEAMELAISALNELEKYGKGVNASYFSNITLNLLGSCIVLKQYDQGNEATKKTLEFLQKGNSNWFLIKYYAVLLAFHTQNYRRAYEIIAEVKPLKEKASLNPRYIELWDLAEAFVKLLIRVGKIAAGESTMEKEVSKFRITTFLNQMPTYSQDKRGINASILILHVLFLLEKKQYEKVIDRMESLNMYCHRHLRRDDSFRTNCFIKMLLEIPKAHFNRIATIRRTAPLLKKLQSAPTEAAGQSGEVELIPYEELWKIALELLPARFK